MGISRAAIIFWLALGWLVFTLAYGYGLLSYKYNLWPYTALAEFGRFVAGNRGETEISGPNPASECRPTDHGGCPALPYSAIIGLRSSSI